MPVATPTQSDPCVRVTAHDVQLAVNAARVAASALLKLAAPATARIFDDLADRLLDVLARE